jgi:hypothetical protein
MNATRALGRSYGFVIPALLLVLASPALAGQIDGQVMGPAGVTPITSAVVTFYNLDDGSSSTSLPTGAEGSYVTADLPAGRYDVAVQTERGLWLVDDPIELAKDETRTLSLSLRELAYWEGADQPPESTVTSGETVVGRAVILDTSTKAGAPPTGRQRKIWTGVGIGLGVLALALWAGDTGSDDDQGEASPFTP